MMMQPDSRFYAVVNEQEEGALLFMRLQYPTVEVLDSDKAYQALVSDPGVSIAGSTKSVSKQLLSLICSIQQTTATISSSELRLRCTDKKSVQLLVKLPLTPIPAKALLRALHSGLMIATASLEGALLETIGVERHTEIGEATLPSLDSLHGPLLSGGQPVELGSAFRRVAAADTRYHAARGFAVAHVAEKVRREILEKRKERKDQERRKRQRERERVREANKLIKSQRITGAKRPKVSLFDDIDVDSPEDDGAPGSSAKARIESKDPHTTANSSASVARAPLQQESHQTVTGTAALRPNPGRSVEISAAPDSSASGVHRNQHPPADPSQRRKKRKIRKLV